MVWVQLCTGLGAFWSLEGVRGIYLAHQHFLDRPFIPSTDTNLPDKHPNIKCMTANMLNIETQINDIENNIKQEMDP